MKTHSSFSFLKGTGLNFLLGITAILLGGMIYFFLRPVKPILVEWIGSAYMNNWHSLPGPVPDPLRHLLPGWFVFSLPEGLWSFGYTMLITGIWHGSSSRFRFFWMATVFLITPGIEYFQLFHLIPGTFCIQDMALGMAGTILGIITGKIITKHQKYETAFV